MNRSRRLASSPLIFSLLVCAGCRSLADDPGTPGALTPTPASVVPTKEAPQAAQAEARSPNEPRFAVVVEGACPELSVALVDGAELIVHGHDSTEYEVPRSKLVFARATSEGGLVEEPSLGRGLRPAGDAVPSWRSIYFSSLTGKYPDDLQLETASPGGERVGVASFAYKWKKGTWALDAATDDNGASADVLRVPWSKGSTLTLGTRTDMYPVFHVTPKGAATPPDFSALRVKAKTDCVFDRGDVLTRPSGEVLLAGSFCGIYSEHEEEWFTTGEPAVATWTPGERARVMALPKPKNKGWLHVTALREGSPTTTYAFGTLTKKAREGQEPQPPAPYLAQLDGASWSEVALPYTTIADEMQVDATGTAWVVAGRKLYERAPATSAAEATWKTHALEKVSRVAWIDHRPAFVIADGVVVRHDEGGAWTPIALPAPVFASTTTAWRAVDVKLTASHEPWIIASYTEKRPEWTKPEERFGVLRWTALASPPRAARCEASEPQGPTFSSWPEPAKDGCADPLAVLVRVSKSTPRAFTFPQTRAALKGHTELEGTPLVEIDLDGRHFLAAKPATLDVGRKLVEAIGRGVAGTHPELVCAKPTAIARAIEIDYATGNVRPPAP